VGPAFGSDGNGGFGRKGQGGPTRRQGRVESSAAGTRILVDYANGSSATRRGETKIKRKLWGTIIFTCSRSCG